MGTEWERGNATQKVGSCTGAPDFDAFRAGLRCNVENASRLVGFCVDFDICALGIFSTHL
jgi:hypothetical protein